MRWTAIIALGCLAPLGCDRGPTPSAPATRSASSSALDASPSATPAASATTRSTREPFALTLSFEGAPASPPPALVYCDPPRVGGQRAQRVVFARSATPGQTSLDLGRLADGTFEIFVDAAGFAGQWFRVQIADGVVSPASATVTLYAKRWVTIRYAFNRNGPDLSPDVAPPKRATLTHWGHLPNFGEDWQVWQGRVEPYSMFGPDLQLEFHRIADGYGFATPASGEAFDDLLTAPTDPAAYGQKRQVAVPGLTLLCRVLGNSPVGGQSGYGKIVIESVSTTRPVTP